MGPAGTHVPVVSSTSALRKVIKPLRKSRGCLPDPCDTLINNQEGESCPKRDNHAPASVVCRHSQAPIASSDQAHDQSATKHLRVPSPDTVQFGGTLQAHQDVPPTMSKPARAGGNADSAQHPVNSPLTSACTAYHD